MTATWIAVLLSLLCSASTSVVHSNDQDNPITASPPHSVALHFSDRPPVTLEIDSAAQNGPRVIVTNLHQAPLTALIIRTEPQTERERPQTVLADALVRSGLIAPVPRGLNFIINLPRNGQEAAPSTQLIAALWEDGSTFGPPDALQSIASAHSTVADAYAQAISLLQGGLDKNWTQAQYLSAADQHLTAATASRNPTSPISFDLSAQVALTANAGASAVFYGLISTLRHNGSDSDRVSRSARILVDEYAKYRDALKQSVNLVPHRNPDAASNR